MDMNKFNPEINWQGKHVKISLAGLFGAAIMIILNPASAAAILPASWVPIVSAVAPQLIAGALGSGILYNMDPNKTTGPQPAQMSPEMVQGLLASLLAANAASKAVTATIAPSAAVSTAVTAAAS